MPKEPSNHQYPPYMSYGVFTKSIEIFADATVPSGPIDRRVLHGFSGADYGALISGLRFMDLVDDERKATASFRELVAASKEAPKFKEKLHQLIAESYRPVLGDINLTHGTSTELEKAFKEYGVSVGQMLTKSIRFFLKAASEAGYSLSPFLTAPKPRVSAAGKRNGARRPKSRVGRQPRTEGAEALVSEIPAGFERLPLPGMPNSFIQYPAGITEAQCQVLEAMVGVLRTSVAARTGGKEKKP